jgi:hypothetical protein
MTLCAVFQEDLFMLRSQSYDTNEDTKKKSRWGRKETENHSMAASSYDTPTEKTKSRWGKKESEIRKSDGPSTLRVDNREEAETETGRKKGKSSRQQLEGPQAKVVFHHFSADSAEAVLKVEGESAAPSLNSEWDVMIKVEVGFSVLLFVRNCLNECLTFCFIEFVRRRPQPSRRMIAFCAVGLILACLTLFAYLQLRALILWATSLSVVVRWKGSRQVTVSQRW